MSICACSQGREVRVTDLLYAVGDRNEAAVRRLAAAHIGLEARNEVGATPLIEATGSAQFAIAEILIDSGADVFAADSFGVTAGLFAERSKVAPDSAQGIARSRILQKMAAKGFPFPAPQSAQVKQMIEAGRWPPHPAAHGG